MRRESCHKYPQHTRLHSRLLLGEPATFVGHMAWILCIVESRNNISIFLESVLKHFPYRNSSHSNRMAGNDTVKSTHKELAEPFLYPLGLL